MTPKTIFRSVHAMFTRNLALLWIGQTISMAGDSVYTKALIWLLLDMTGSSGTTGLVAVSAYLPTLLTGVWAGAVVDRSDHRKVMIAADGVRALLVLLVPILFAAGALTPSLLFCITFLVATGATFFNPARDALIPSLVSERTHLLRANALIQSSWMFALLLGPAVAMALLSILGARTQHLFVFGAAAYLVSLVCIVALDTARKTQDSARGPSTLHRDLAEGVRYAFKNPVVRGLLLITAADNLFIMGPAGVGMAVFVREVLKRDIGSLMAIEVCYAIGMIAGTALLPLWNKRLGFGKILIAGMVLDGATFVPLLWVDSLWGTMATIVIHSLAIPLLVVPRPALVQHIVPVNLQGRVFSMIGVTVVGFTAISTGLTGLVTEWIPMPQVYAFIGVAAALCGVWGYTMKDLREAVSASRVSG
ncbi:MAG TPA: MFS transporter [Candidatus Latescibacteria bacterium]|nr:MFS transporter [Candidatus Latescibacterota bacterium]HOS63334.1 MFS transporter [Candidatus Latescibacterota bacterium]HPK74483.1 MFS transporter [Candidatus Latescibacterota bacterium]